MKHKKSKSKSKAKKRTSTSKRERTSLHYIQVQLTREHTAYVDEIAEYACVDREVVCAVMMATGIFQAKRYRLPDRFAELQAKLDHCRKIMEANDPGNAREIFGAPEPTPAPPPETPA